MHLQKDYWSASCCVFKLGGGGGVEQEYNVQNSFVSWSRIALNDEGSNEPVVTVCVDHDLAVAS